MTVPFTTQSLQDALTAKLALNFGTEPGEATDQEMLKACALVLRDVMALRGVQTAKETKKEQKKPFPWKTLLQGGGFCLMGLDKHRARTRQWRVPEKILFGAALLGGSAGAWAGMYVFHHKTRHWYFVVGIPLILAAQLVLAVYFTR